MTCRDCRFAVFRDYGYSNGTVEGSDFNCAKQLHPDGMFEPTFDDDKRLAFAAKCAGFVAGECIDLDVEEEGLAQLSPVQKETWNMFMNQKEKR